MMSPSELAAHLDRAEIFHVVPFSSAPIDANAQPNLDAPADAWDQLQSDRLQYMDRELVSIGLRSALAMKTDPWPQPLAKHDFFEQLRSDKLRADRTRSQLSVIVIRTVAKIASVCVSVDRFLMELGSTIRETDTLGYLADDRLGLILPETGKRHAQTVTERIYQAGKGVVASVTTHTYPADLFDELERLPESGDKPLSRPEVLLEEAGPRMSATGAFLKRSMDIAGAGAGMLLTAPLLLLVGVAIKTTSPGPIIFRQVRLGKGCVPFVIYKFRSMRTDADEAKHRAYVEKLINGNLHEINNGDTSKPLYKLTGDDRITPVGRFIRKWSLDELPQFINVLKGDMSLVGPRPPLPYEAEAYHAWHLRRVLEIKPGITGLWQVEGRSKTSFDEMVRLDLKYIRTWSLLLDIKLLLKTIKVVLRREGAE
jgi:lipopolysaccharide/colanic/teichoic acid biosynthesis glycosyltransferase